MPSRRNAPILLRFGLLIVGLIPPLSVAQAPTPESAAWEADQEPPVLAMHYAGGSRWADLDAMIVRLATTDARDPDGRPTLYRTLTQFNDWMIQWSVEEDALFKTKFADYQKRFPQSAFAAMLPALQMNAAAWRARGLGFSSTVTPEGRRLYQERSRKAWDLILRAKPKAASLPIWYESALWIGQDAERPPKELLALLQEGLQRHKGYFPMYFSIMRSFSPRWGGDYGDADAFIVAQVASSTNLDGEALYTRLYWVFDQYTGERQDFFDASRVDWPRLRKGFELLMKKYPASARNRAYFVSYACRAHDKATYRKWGVAVSDDDLMQVTPEGLTPEICDARLGARR
jgi:hypothetical protein